MYLSYNYMLYIPGADPGGGGADPARALPKVGKNMIFWRKIVIFHTKYPKNFRASLRSSILFLINFNYFISIYIFI